MNTNLRYISNKKARICWACHVLRLCSVQLQFLLCYLDWSTCLSKLINCSQHPPCRNQARTEKSVCQIGPADENQLNCNWIANTWESKTTEETYEYFMWTIWHWEQRTTNSEHRTKGTCLHCVVFRSFNKYPRKTLLHLRWLVGFRKIINENTNWMYKTYDQNMSIGSIRRHFFSLYLTFW